MLRFLQIILLILFFNVDMQSSSLVDTIPLQQKLRLNIFLDCSDCDHDFIRQNFDFVNYVRAPADADVFMLISKLPAGSGGYRYNIFLTGMNRFISMNDTVVFHLPLDISREEERIAILNKIQVSLVYYLIKTPLGDRVQIVISKDRDIEVRETPGDPWRDWVFDLSLSGNLSGNRSNLSYSLMHMLYISKITSKIKFESSNTVDYSEERFKLFDGDSLIFSTRSVNRSYCSQNLFVKSLGEHGGVGGIMHILSSTHKNLDFQLRAGPAIEGNLYKYSQASNKQLRLIYSMFYEHNNYGNRTINNRMSDDHFRNELNLIFRKIGTWGYVDLSVNARANMEDISQYSANASAFANINLYKGISFTMGMGLGLHRDQISLSQEAITVDQVLIQQREMPTSYSYNLNFGISFSFGSKFNNHVNPRFSY